jgi:hypothetical protein
MVRRSSLASVGGFGVRTLQLTDLDLWVRILAYYDAAFIDKDLSTYRRSNDSLSGRNLATQVAWMDRLWLIESLLSFPEIRNRYPQIVRMQAEERRMAWRTAARGALGMKTNSGPPRKWVEYLAYRVRSRVRGAELFGHPVEFTPMAERS